MLRLLVWSDLNAERLPKPTFKIGLPQVGAPDWQLESMLTLRSHLDGMTGANGPLQGSHKWVRRIGSWKAC